MRQGTTLVINGAHIERNVKDRWEIVVDCEVKKVTREEKEKIDVLWMETRLGKCILLIADGKREEAKELHIKAFCEGCVYGAFDEKENVTKEIIKQISTLEEWREYLMMLDENIIEALYETRALFGVDWHFLYEH